MQPGTYVGATEETCFQCLGWDSQSHEIIYTFPCVMIEEYLQIDTGITTEKHIIHIYIF